MGLVALFLVLLAVWLVATGRLKRMTMLDGAMLGVALVGAVLAARGKPVMGGIPLLLSTLYSFRRFYKPRPRGAPSPAHAADDAAIREARALLGVDENADADAIRAAHRRLISKIHPDAGGTEALAEKINEARAILLRHTLERNGAQSAPPSSDN